MDTEQGHILVVDDNEDNRRLLVRRVKAMGHLTETAVNGRLALETIRAASFDLILLDIQMPEMNGFEVLSELKADPILSRIPVIVISANSEDENAIQAIRMGAEDFLPKPYNKHLLEARVSTSLAKKKLRDRERSYRRALEAANEAKTEFISFVSHELKSPMTSIKGYAQLLIGGGAGPINESQSSFVQIIGRNVDRMARLVTDLEDISRIETGHIRLDMEEVPLTELVDEIVESIKAQVEGKKQALNVELAQDLPCVWGDRFRLSQVLSNLVSNAYKYTPEKGEIGISAHRLNGRYAIPSHIEPHLDETMIHITVRDTGIGIRPEDQDTVFEKFFRADDEAMHGTPGTGLGLNITKNLIEMHNGRIWCESQYREGTTFHVVLPVAS
ncbi:MAG: hybrid sensor histidine kinase/response regulator [Chloroflexota bacterium]